MLYLYTIMMSAWDLDSDTHSHFRKYLDGFINKRKISKDLREYVINTRSLVNTYHIRPRFEPRDEKDKFNELRIGLRCRVVEAMITYKGSSPIYEVNNISTPNLIEKLHPRNTITMQENSVLHHDHIQILKDV